ncbi:DNA-binding transcriptional regulator, LysR family [Paenibacillus sp. UNC496MF]|uniref:LysR family transcriptional regulator n=1 Tax=Paenibacillus sp. UNC496MF TaxID=1502753 RepID=UPI0008F3734A|nr:LysR substrate-binding domain-containing protein [Paenibacillus sp. UNC496MF]SFI37143.1 DNA-binding transcriptional regulator, LysR family [Paenibacillus sp. UNC496MF]
MELKQLHYFMAVCEELHFARAAEKTGVSAPNISQQIRGLEEELGVLLFERSGKRILLTEAGEILREHGAAVFGHLRRASDAIADLKQTKGGSLVIGVLPGDADLMFDSLVLAFHRAHPAISLSLLESADVTERVLDRTIDVGVTIEPVADERLTKFPLFREEFALAVAASDPLAREASVPLRRLQTLKTVLFPPEHQCRRLIDRFCMEHGFRLRPHMETTTLSSLLRMVESGIGACVLPRLLLDHIDRKDIATVRLTQPVPSQDICLIYRSDRYVGHAMRAFIKALRGHVEAIVAQANTS